MKATLYSLLPILQNWPLWLQVLVVIAATAVVAIGLRAFLRLAETLYKRTKNMWDDTIIYAVRRPLYFLLWGLGLLIAYDIWFGAAAAERYLPTIRSMVAIFFIAWVVLRILSNMEQQIIQKEKRKKSARTTIQAIMRVGRLAVMVIAAILLLDSAGISTSGIMAAGGVGGLAVGFAAKDLLANFFGAMMIYLDRPFNVGDWIRSPDRNIEGTVEDIGWRLTTIRTFDKRLLYVPNSIFTTIAVENPSRMSHRRIKETIGVRYTDMGKASAIVADVKQMLETHKDIDPKQTLMVHVNEFGASSVDFFIYCFTRTTDWQEFHAVKQDVLLHIGEIVAKHGADIAFPTQVVQFERV